MNVLSNISLEPYGYSHGDQIGIKITGYPSGYNIDFEQINELLLKRKGSSKYNTTRSESENLELVSGFDQTVTNGQQIHIVIKQNNFRSSDYDFGLVRPGHADLSAYQKYGEDFNYSGGGQFSGRLTILYVIAGEIARQILAKINQTRVFGHVSQVGSIKDVVTDYTQIQKIQDQPFPMVDQTRKQRALEFLTKLKQEGNSIGGKLDLYIDNLSANFGDDFFGSLESKIAFLMYSVPAVKAVEFGLGTEFAVQKGTEVVEKLNVVDGRVASLTNYNGGINGGIANLAAPIHLKLTIKATSSIFDQIETVKYNDGKFEPATLQLKGRHDSFIANRALWPAIGLLNILILDLEMGKSVR